MTIKMIKCYYEQIRETLEALRSAREAAAAYDEWKCNPSVARPWDEVDAELSAGDKPNGFMQLKTTN